MSERPTEALRRKASNLLHYEWMRSLCDSIDDLDATLATKDQRIADLQFALSIFRCELDQHPEDCAMMVIPRTKVRLAFDTASGAPTASPADQPAPEDER